MTYFFHIVTQGSMTYFFHIVTQGSVTYYLGNGVLRLYGDAQQKEEGRQQGLHTMFNHLGGLAGRANNEINCEIFLIV